MRIFTTKNIGSGGSGDNEEIQNDILELKKETFEKISKNLNSKNSKLFYLQNGDIDKIEYGTGENKITKNLNYNSSGGIKTIVLSGSSIEKDYTKTLVYDSEGNIININYT